MSSHLMVWCHHLTCHNIGKYLLAIGKLMDSLSHGITLNQQGFILYDYTQCDNHLLVYVSRGKAVAVLYIVMHAYDPRSHCSPLRFNACEPAGLGTKAMRTTHHMAHPTHSSHSAEPIHVL